jgi:hypothetical protein
MSIRQLTIRFDDEELASAIQQQARETDRSVNQVAVDLLRRAVGLPRTRRVRIGDQLDAFAGDMSEEEAEEVLAAVSCFEQIDDEFWR